MTIDWDKDLECDHGDVFVLKTDLNGIYATVKYEKGLDLVKYRVGEDGSAPDFLGPKFDVRNKVNYGDKAMEDLKALATRYIDLAYSSGCSELDLDEFMHDQCSNILKLIEEASNK